MITSRAVVKAVAVGDGLDLLTEIAAPLRVRLAIADGVLALTTHGEGPWWATVRVAAQGEGSASAWVGRLDLRQAVDAEALLVPDATCSVTIVQDDVVRYGGFALAAMNPPDPDPPALGGSRIPVDVADIGAGGRYDCGDGRTFELPASSLERFTARSIDAAEIIETDGGPCLVGLERGTGDAALVLVAQGEWT